MSKRPPNLRKLAARQRWLMWMVLLLLFVQILPYVAERLFPPGPAAEAVFLLIGVLALVVMILVVVGAVMIMAVDGTHVAMIILVAILLFAPCINLVILLLINRRASRVLRATGARVGLMGVNREELERILDPTLCTNCGYNLTGNLSGRCPECGESLPLTPPTAPLPPGVTRCPPPKKPRERN